MLSHLVPDHPSLDLPQDRGGAAVVLLGVLLVVLVGQLEDRLVRGRVS